MKKHFYLKFVVFAFAVSRCCFAVEEVKDLVDIQRINTDRCAAYNSDSNEIQVNGAIKPKPDALSDYTGSINTFLTNKKNVNPKRHATEDEQREILQPLMATALIYGVTTTYAHHGLSEGHALYWHFEILRAVEHLSGLYTLQLRDNKSERFYCDEWDNDYKILAFRGGITGTMFHCWFADTLAQHGAGLKLQGSIYLPSTVNAARYVNNNHTIIARAIVYIFENETKLVPVKKREALIQEILKRENGFYEKPESCCLFTNEGYDQYADELEHIRVQLESLSKIVKQENGFIRKKSRATRKVKGLLGAVAKAIENSEADAELAVFNDFDFAITKISSGHVVDDVTADENERYKGKRLEQMQDVLEQYGVMLQKTADSLRAESGVSFSRVTINHMNGYEFLLDCIARIKTATRFLKC